MDLRVFYPSEELKPFIKCYYLSESRYTDFVNDVFFADGCLEVVFHVGLDFYRGEEKESWAKVIGQITQPLAMTAIGTGKSFGIWFWPHTFSVFSRIPINEFNDKAIPLDAIFSNTFISVIKNCMLENDVRNLVQQTNAYLSEKLSSNTLSMRDEIATHAVHYILREKAASNLDKLASDCNISNRNLQKLFKERIGVSPKFFVRIARFQYVLQHLISDPSASLTGVTYSAGYYDQAHFIREFKEFTGLTPSQFQVAKHPINQYFLHL